MPPNSLPLRPCPRTRASTQEGLSREETQGGGVALCLLLSVGTSHCNSITARQTRGAGSGQLNGSFIT